MTHERNRTFATPLRVLLLVVACSVTVGNRASADYVVVPASAGNLVRLAVEAPSDWTVRADIVALPAWMSNAELTCTQHAEGAEVLLAFDVAATAELRRRATVVVEVTARDATGHRERRVFRKLALQLATDAPALQESYQVDECCMSLVGRQDSPAGRLDHLVLLGAAPNPWRTSTAVRFGLPRPSTVTMRIVDVAGRLVRTVRTPELEAGYHQLPWDGRDESGQGVATGLYFYRLSAGPWKAAGKMFRLR